MTRVPVLFVAFTVFAGCGGTDQSSLFGDTGSSLEPPGSGGRGSGGRAAADGGAAPIIVTAGTGGDPTVGMMPTELPPDPPPPLGAGGVPSTGGAPNVGLAGSAGMGSADAGSLSPLAQCDFSGTWGTLIRVPVTWPDAPLILHGGAGEVAQWNISKRVRDTKSSYHEATSVCGINLPDLTGAALVMEEKFGIRFPNSIFDQGGIPPVVFSTIVNLATSDAQWSAGPVALQTGLIMADPSNAPWPMSFTSDQTPDQDHDGALGVTVTAVDPMMDPSYNFPPVGLPTALGADYPRANKISVVVRTVTNLHGTALSCDQLRAGVDIINIQDKPALNSMVIGCTKVDKTKMPPREVTCVDSEAQFLNAQRPVFTPSGPGTLVSVRLPDNAGCPQVRAKLPL